MMYKVLYTTKQEGEIKKLVI